MSIRIVFHLIQYAIGVHLLHFVFLCWILISTVPFAALAKSISPSTESEKHFSKDEIKADLRYFIKFIQDIHPDPYSAFGGQVAFQLEAQRLLKQVPTEGLTNLELYNLLRHFLGKMRDGHSYIESISSHTNSSELKYLPVRFKVAFDTVFILEAQAPYQDLIGYRLEAIGGHSMEELREAAVNVLPKENEFAAFRLVTHLVRSNNRVGKLLPNVKDKVKLSLIDPAGKEITRVLPYTLSREAWESENWKSTRWEEIPSSGTPFFSRVWQDRNTAYLKIGTVMAREAFEIMKETGRTDLEEHLDRFYSRILRKQRPQNLEDAISEIPSISKITYELLLAMKQHKITNLIVDLRSNGGGWSPIMKPFYYMLHGDHFFEEDPVFYATRISNDYLEILGTTLETLNKDREEVYEIGDLIINGGTTAVSARAEREKYLADLQRLGLSYYSYIESLDGAPIYTPKVYVITDPGTFSAAYDLTYHLWRLGAKTVGVPPSQTANSFVEGTPFELPNTSLRGAISRTAVTYPGLPEENHALILDYPFKWTDFQKYDFDLHSEILFILDLMNY